MPNTILIADDNALIRRLVLTHLESEPGYAVCESAATGVEAIERIAEHTPDLIILDLSMPEMNGLQVATALKLMQYDIPIILFSAFIEIVPEYYWRSMGIRSAVSKSAPIEVLLNEVHKIIPKVRSASV